MDEKTSVQKLREKKFHYKHYVLINRIFPQNFLRCWDVFSKSIFSKNTCGCGSAAIAAAAAAAVAAAAQTLSRNSGYGINVKIDKKTIENHMFKDIHRLLRTVLTSHFNTTPNNKIEQ